MKKGKVHFRDEGCFTLSIMWSRRAGFMI